MVNRVYDQIIEFLKSQIELNEINVVAFCSTLVSEKDLTQELDSLTNYVSYANNHLQHAIQEIREKKLKLGVGLP